MTLIICERKTIDGMQKEYERVLFQKENLKLQSSESLNRRGFIGQGNRMKK